MADNEYMIALNKAMNDLDSRLLRRDILNTEITGLKETVRVLSSRVQLSADKEKQVAQLLAMADYATPNLKDSIRALLVRAGKDLNAIEVRDALESSGFNFDDFSNPLSACHATLKRMDADGEVKPTKTKDGKTSYRIKLKVTLPSPPKYYGGEMTIPVSGLDALKQPAADYMRRLKGGMTPPPKPREDEK